MKMIILLATAGLLGAAQAASAAGIHEGRWAYTMTMDMPGMPAMPKVDASKLPPGMNLPQRTANGISMNFEHCVTNADLVPKNDAQDRCKVTRMDRQGDTVNWASICDSPQGKMEATGTATYSGDTMTSTTHMTGTDARGKPIDMTQKISGRYVGACTK
ncbi:MAG: DUF3617 domain-containing protein [Solimonas sp.]